MKVKSIHYHTITAKQFFLLMIAPLMIGLLITFTSFAHAEWNQTEDPLLSQAPKKQGWVQIGTQDSSANLMKSQKEPVKTASR